jgi:hypothetical protein
LRLREDDRKFISDMANGSWIVNTGINYLIEFSTEIIKCSQQTIRKRINDDRNAEESMHTCQPCNKLFHTLGRFADMQAVPPIKLILQHKRIIRNKTVIRPNK